MKRLITLSLSILFTITLFGQKWVKEYHPADELLETETNYIYTSDKVGTEFIYPKSDSSFVWNFPLFLSKKSKVFEKLLTSGFVRVGLYAANGKLVNKGKLFYYLTSKETIFSSFFSPKWYSKWYKEWYVLDFDKTDETNTFTYGDLRCNELEWMEIDTIVNYLINKDGYIRFVTENWEYELVDLKIPCFN